MGAPARHEGVHRPPPRAQASQAQRHGGQDPHHGAPEEDDLYKLLKRAYIESRYSKSYRITPAELATLGGWVTDLARRVEAACREKIASF